MENSNFSLSSWWAVFFSLSCTNWLGNQKVKTLPSCLLVFQTVFQCTWSGNPRNQCSFLPAISACSSLPVQCHFCISPSSVLCVCVLKALISKAVKFPHSLMFACPARRWDEWEILKNRRERQRNSDSCVGIIFFPVDSCSSRCQAFVWPSIPEERWLTKASPGSAHC